MEDKEKLAAVWAEERCKHIYDDAYWAEPLVEEAYLAGYEAGQKDLEKKRLDDYPAWSECCSAGLYLDKEIRGGQRCAKCHEPAFAVPKSKVKE